MKKIEIEKMNNKQLEYAFLKLSNTLLNNNTVFLKTSQKLFFVYSFKKLDILNNLEVIKDILVEKNFIINIIEENNLFFVTHKKNTATANKESIALIKCYLHANTNGHFEFPENF